jgi:hypothetical protein
MKALVSDPNTMSPFLRENIFPHYPSSEISLFPTVFTICFDKVHLQKSIWVYKNLSGWGEDDGFSFLF